MAKAKTVYVPVTPGGTYCDWLAGKTEKQAINKLLKDVAHMPYKTWENFQKRGYTIEKVEMEIL